MQGGALFQTGIHRVEIGGIFKKAAILNSPGNSGQVLKNHAPTANIGVAYLAVAHLAVRQAHVQAGGGEGCVGEFLKKLVQAGRLRSVDGVAGIRVCHAKAVHDNQSRRCFVHIIPSFADIAAADLKRIHLVLFK